MDKDQILGFIASSVEALILAYTRPYFDKDGKACIILDSEIYDHIDNWVRKSLDGIEFNKEVDRYEV